MTPLLFLLGLALDWVCVGFVFFLLRRLRQAHARTDRALDLVQRLREINDRAIANATACQELAESAARVAGDAIGEPYDAWVRLREWQKTVQE